MDGLTQEQRQDLLAAGAPWKSINDFQKALQALNLPSRPTLEKMKVDTSKARGMYRAGAKLMGFWPPKLKRDAAQGRAADIVKSTLRTARNAFAHAYVELIFSRVTNGYRRYIRAEDLVYEVSDLCPGLCPTREEVETESEMGLAEKDGVEIAQSDFLSQVFSNRLAGLYLIHSMLQPLPQAQELLEKFRQEGRLSLGTAQVERRGPLGCVFYSNSRYLNAEDDTTVLPLEIATDLVLLDSRVEVGLLRGGVVDHPRYQGRRVFSAGLNLTHLYQGKISMMFYLTRELGFVNKLYRGLAGADFDPEGPEVTLEKPWIAALEAFAIGGGCQVLLVLDYVIAEEGSYFNLPARKEGIVPGVAPMRFSRFVGERVAQQGILFDSTFPVDSPEARSIVNEVVPSAQMDEAIKGILAKVTEGGLISAGANRKAIRIGQESRDRFRQYMALYCREQADCHFSAVLIGNLERNWNAKNRRSE